METRVGDGGAVVLLRASFIARCLSRFIDSLVVGLVLWATVGADYLKKNWIADIALTFSFYTIQYAIFDTTLGRYLLGLDIVHDDVALRPVLLPTYAMREAVYTICNAHWASLVLFLACMAINGRGVHDVACGTVVVENASTWRLLQRVTRD